MFKSTIELTVKTARRAERCGHLNHEQRVYWLNNARTLASTLQDPILPRLFNAVDRDLCTAQCCYMNGSVGLIDPHAD